MEKRLVIVGAGGYLASNVMPLLAKSEGINLFALTSKESIYSQKNNVRFIKIDLKDYNMVGEVLNSDCDVAVNFSWLGARGENQEEDEVQKTNEKKCICLLNSLIKRGCRRFIQIGSIAEYGIVNGNITESTECHPVTAYAKRKLSCANSMKRICDEEGIEFFELRMGSMYGNYMDRRNLLGYLCRELSHGHRVKLKTSCTQDWEYTHVNDLAEILIEAIEEDILPGIYNITNGETYPLKYFIHIIEGKYGLSDHVEFGEIEQGIGCQNIRCDISKLKSAFGKTDFITFKDGIDSVISSIKERGL